MNQHSEEAKLIFVTQRNTLLIFVVNIVYLAYLIFYVRFLFYSNQGNYLPLFKVLIYLSIFPSVPAYLLSISTALKKIFIYDEQGGLKKKTTYWGSATMSLINKNLITGISRKNKTVQISFRDHYLNMEVYHWNIPTNSIIQAENFMSTIIRSMPVT